MDLSPLTQNPSSSALALLVWVVIYACWNILKHILERKPAPHSCSCAAQCKWSDSDREEFLKHCIKAEQLELQVRDLGKRVSKVYVMQLLNHKRRSSNDGQG